LPYNGAYEFMETASDYNYFMLIPQAPADTWWDAPLIEQGVVELVSATQEQFSIDTDRIYITGLSAGAFGMWAIVSDNPDIFAAGISVAGGLAAPRDLSRIAHIPFQVFHGSEDSTVPVAESRSIVEALREPTPM
jgi:predicted peptidase